MPINVTCPGCLKRFTVADKHAGKQGPCPSCKKTITIPKLEDQVVIHEQPTGPTDSKGRSVLKTFRRKDSKFSPIMALSAVGVVVVACLIAFLLKGYVAGAETVPAVLVMCGAAAFVGPFVAAGGYMFLRDDELEPYRGSQLWLRAIACGVSFALAWLLFGFILSRFTTPEDVSKGLEFYQLLVPLAVMIMVGLLAGYASLDLDPGSAVMLFALFFIFTGLLRLLMGLSFVPGLVFG
ncbi:hypothetical protein [Aeoliella sp.]|uniref:hypothetical protein n=1 Tax=Aeoliella sp. TaxID=2795800 RepID=UPI003CCB922C